MRYFAQTVVLYTGKQQGTEKFTIPKLKYKDHLTATTADVVMTMMMMMTMMVMMNDGGGGAVDRVYS